MSPGPSPGRAAARAIDLVPVALVVVAEAAWTSVVGGLLQLFVLDDVVVGLPAFVGFVAGGLVLARLAGRATGRRTWAGLAIGAIAVTAGVGVLLAPDAREALGKGGIGAAIAAHPGGLVAGLALFRGFAHARWPLAESTVAHLLALGVPGIAFAALVGGLIAEPFRSRFLGDAFGAAAVFLAGAILALALVRLTAIGRDAGFDWRRNPTWLVLAVGLVGLAVAAALPMSGVAGRALEILVTIAIGPLLVGGILTGLNRAGLPVLVFTMVGAVLAFALSFAFDQGGAGPAAGPPGAVDTTPTPLADVVSIGIGTLALLLAAATVVLLVAIWLARTRPPEPDPVDETRRIDRGRGEERPRARRRAAFWRRPEPADAVAAYRALIDDLAADPLVRREPRETPAGHAARLRATGGPRLGLDLLAADYALVRYGGLDLSAAEDRRAVRRWRRLRRVLVAAAPGSGGRRRPTSGDPNDDDAPAGGTVPSA